VYSFKAGLQSSCFNQVKSDFILYEDRCIQANYTKNRFPLCFFVKLMNLGRLRIPALLLCTVSLKDVCGDMHDSYSRFGYLYARLEKALGVSEAVGIRLVPRRCLSGLGAA
jgi:hypothetical protein